MEIKATVALITGRGDGRYAVTWPADRKLMDKCGIKKEDSITFSLTVWQGIGVDPLKGQIVLLEGVTEFVGGWRATSARPILAEKPETRKEKI